MKKTLLQIIALICIELIIFLPLYTANALTISNLNVTSVTASSAKISWTTNEYSTGKVKYGSTTDLGFAQTHSNFLFEHSLFLTGLSSETKHYFAIESIDINGTMAIDNNSGRFYAFTTLDITPPKQVTGLKAENATINSVFIAWNKANESDLSHYNIYRDRVKIANTAKTSFQDANLSHSTLYSYKVSAVDLSGNEGSLSDSIVVQTLIPDIKAPSIANLQVIDITDTTAAITWLTDENSTSIVYYGLNETLNNVKEGKTFIANHTITIQQLIKGKEYSFVASSCDKDDNCINSTKQSFTAGKDSTAPEINVKIPEFVNTRTIDIIGTTETFSDVKLFVNNLNIPARFLDSSRTAAGAIEFFNVVLQKENVIKITAKDKAGNENEKTFRVSVDTEDPEIVLAEIPSVTAKKNITISGTVNEPVIINIFLSESVNASIPEKIIGLNATVKNNSVKLDWDKADISHFSHYVVYRDDTPIAATDSIIYNTFTDLLVNSESTYAYHVTAATIFGKESPKSNPVTVTLPAGGKKGIPKPEAIDILTEAKKTKLSINATGSFSASIKLGNDGTYGLIIEFIDRAKNKVVVEKEITLDTKPPEIKIISPPKGTSIYENYANEVNIEGITEPNAEVHLFVQRTPLGFINKSFDVSGLPNAIENIQEAKLRADCRLAIGGKEFCSTGADFSTTADNDGNFFFEDVDLTSIFAGGISLERQSPTEFTQDEETRESKQSSLVFIATDKSGIRNALRADFNIITCWSGNQTWDIIPLTEFQSPPLISTERLAEGNEHIQFFFNYSYQGRGADGIVETIEISKACRGAELLDEDRFNVSCRVLPEGAASTLINPEGKISYTTLRLNKIENMNKWLEDDWKKFFKQLGTEITFPLKVRMTYKHKVDGREVREVQTVCQEVSYLVDNSRIDPRKVLPDWLLFDAVDFLDDAVKTLNDVKKEVDRVLEYVVVGCVSTFLLRLIVQVYRRFVTFLEEKKFIIKAGIGQLTANIFSFSKDNDETNKYCNEVVKNVINGYKLGKTDSIADLITSFSKLKLKYFSDGDLKKCFPNIASAWDTEAALYKSYRFTCDRVFGHKAPSRWTETRTDEELTTKLQTAEGCAIDQGVQGQPLRAVSCREVANKYKPTVKPEDYNLDEKCFEVFDATGRQATLYRLGEKVPETENLYKISWIPGLGQRKIDYAVKDRGSETSYITAQPRTCAEVCGITGAQTGEPKGRAKIVGSGTNVPTASNPGAQWECIQASQCKALSKNPQNVEGIKVTTSVPRGYSQDCFYQAGAAGYGYAPQGTQSPNSVSDDPTQRFECCCLNAIKAPPTTYYQPKDINLYASPDGNNFAFENTNSPDIPPENFDSMAWSYRYWKEKYQTRGADKALHTEYNPYRYISGRDLSACFGRNNWVYDGISNPAGQEPGNLLIIDPSTQHTSAFQCLNIAGISNRLTFLNNLMSQLSGCLKQVRTTGTADAGVCKELFTQYVCSSLWNVIQWFTNACLPFGTGYDFTKSDNDIVQYISGGVQSVWGSIADSQQELMNEYGNAKLRNLLGAGEEAIARKICLAAFGYDWEINLQDIVDAAYAQSFASLVTAPTGTREFLTIDPQSGQAKYEYRASWIINPGCEIENYRVELACVGRNQIDKYPGINCKAVNDPGGNNCDCKNSPDEKTQSFFSSTRRLAQNVLEDRDHHDIINSVYRYDHLKFILRPDRQIKGDLKAACFPDGHYEGSQGVFYFPLRDRTAKDIASCQVDATSGLFKCVGAQSFWDSKGTAYFISEKINDEVVGRKEIAVKAGEPIILQPTVYKAPGPNQCLVIDVRKNSGTEKVFEFINRDGPQEYSIPIVRSADLTRGTRPETKFEKCVFNKEGSTRYSGKDAKSCDQVFGSKRLTIELISRSSSESNINLRFENKAGSSGEIELNEDSQDILYVDSDAGKMLKEYWDKGQRAIIVDLGDRGKFRIRNIGYDRDIESIEYNINIQPTAENAADERWTVTYALYHFKGNETNCNNYNPAEKVIYQGRTQENSVPVRVTSGAVAANKPKINIRVESRVELKSLSDILEIKADVSDDKQVKKVEYSLTRPDRSKEPFKAMECSQGSPDKSGEDKKECFVSVSQTDLNNLAGTYTVEIIATDSENNEAKNTKTFDVGCVDNNYGKVGQCLKKGDKCARNKIDEPLALACIEGFYCCQIK